MRPVISLVTVTRNCNATIQRTLESVKSIKSPAIQYIVIDGQSTDGTLESIEKHKEIIDILVSERDTGIYNAMNKGVAAASGIYTLFINGDDELVPGAMLAVVKKLESMRAEVVCCNSRMGLNGNKEDFLTPKPSRLFFYNSIPHPSTFVLTSELKKFGFREDLKIASDYDLFLRLFIARKKFKVIDITTSIHHRGGASGDRALSQDEVERVKREHLGGAIYTCVAAVQWLNRLRKKLF